tara:strand:- start:2138 stop:2395 length:258 start_codon:yes stop_codon:yes gene_type:complete
MEYSTEENEEWSQDKVFKYRDEILNEINEMSKFTGNISEIYADGSSLVDLQELARAASLAYKISDVHFFSEFFKKNDIFTIRIKI